MGDTRAATPDGRQLRVASFLEAEDRMLDFVSGARLLHEGSGYICRGCRRVFEVECPKCHRTSPASHLDTALGPIRPEEPLEISTAKGRPWAVVACSCGKRFRVELGARERARRPAGARDEAAWLSER